MARESLQPASIEAQLNFLRTASRSGVDAAVEADGEILTAGEAAALKDLDTEELGSLLAITEKITRTRLSSAMDGSAADWTCVNVVC